MIDNNLLNIDKITEERDKLVYDMIYNRYEHENQITRDLDGKSSGIISISGIIISLQAGIAIFAVKEIPNILHNFPFFIVFLAGIFILMYSMLYALKAYNLQKWIAVPEPKRLIEEYAKKNRDKIDIIRLITKEICCAIYSNKIQNNEKVYFIKCSFLLLVFGIVFIVFESVIILLTVVLNSNL